MSHFTNLLDMSFSLLLHAGVESGDQCLLNSEVLSYFSGVIMSIRSFSYSIKVRFFSVAQSTKTGNKKK